MNTLILVANSSTARIFAVSDDGCRLTLLQALQHPASRLKTAELVTDRPGRVRTGLSSNNLTAVGPHTSPHEVETEKFARELSELLCHLYTNRAFRHIAIVAPPHFLGVLRRVLGSEVGRSLIVCDPRDLTHIAEKDLLQPLNVVLKTVACSEVGVTTGT